MTNCFCCIFPWEIGCEDVENNVVLPPDYDGSPKNVLCPNCCSRMDPVFKATTQYFSICFIPCAFCPMRQTAPYLACPNCGDRFKAHSFRTCQSCQASMSGGEEYCSRCGKRNCYD